MSKKVLAVIDMQNIFADPQSDWFTKDIDTIVPNISDLVKHFGKDVVFTRFISAKSPRGAWKAYYQDWPKALTPPNDPIWDIIPELQESSRQVHGWNGDATTIDKTTFGKFGPEFVNLLDYDDEVYLCGVSTDCCVVATALSLIDYGVKTYVIGDACKGLDDYSEQAALHTMSLFAPICEITETQTVLSTPLNS
jgi:nicotinamidase-related amidase